jgi:GPH family glycoside/pentoside/hexuronide:cation symporter
MNQEKKDIEKEHSLKKVILYSFAGFTDVIFLQFFTFLIFTFYYSVVQLNVTLITIAFMIWSVWNAINDPILGAISDKTSSKWGRRKPFIIAGLVPLLFVNVLLWTPPKGNTLVTFFYFLIIIIIWELFYTMYSLNQTSLFPEMFRDLKQRTKANTSIQIFQVISLLIAFILPGLFIPKYDDPQYFSDYGIAAVIISIICNTSGFIFIIFGIKERIEFSRDPEKAPSFLKSLKYTFRNKSFRFYLVGNFALWYSFGMLPTVFPLYGHFVLGVDEAFIQSLMLGSGFIAAIVFMFFWRIIINKLGAKTSYILALAVFIVTLSPFMFISNKLGGFITMIVWGFGLAGVLIVRDVTMSSIIDEDELITGIRREAGFYGINGFIVKLTNVFIYITIALVFIGTDWAIFDPSSIATKNVFGLRSLMFIFPTIFLILGIISMIFFPINKQKYDKITEDASKLHQEKKEKILSVE